MAEDIFKKEIDEFMESLYNIEFDDKLSIKERDQKIRGELEWLLETVDEQSRNYVIEHRGEFGLRSENDGGF